ncbi:glycosyltransferase family 2 protein [Paenibacillus eucommiae]|uniref:Glucosyl-3-phosphoglycerate synthase n=1 Tax=Paenibacillus eucommiae TaxID=1355755 RepID=A0ABS4IQW3_9BACL|nr:glycosyltransferase family 2 protein [Paenibacillus eucommiae]MBP1988994.1 glycosyltransferase involved in cell wall biosynthesis [Paenibacillus eucommiae]
MTPLTPFVTIIIPAWNEELRISDTLRALQHCIPAHEGISRHEIIVVDDGSGDQTYQEAWPWADRIIRHTKRRGKGAALSTGIAEAKGEFLIFLDADLQDTARYAPLLLNPLLNQDADMVIAKLPAPWKPAGFGFVKRLASKGIYRLSGYKPSAPLSGQRAIRASLLDQVGKLARGFGFEVGLTIDVARLGCRIAEIDVPFRHRESGQDWQGLYHRGYQLASVGSTLFRKWREY